jgi:hypothetical protein
MPALSNPRYERFAQALFIGLAGKTRQEQSQQQAYLAAYPASGTAAAKSSASRLLTGANHIFERVRELQAEQAKRTQRKIDVSRDRLARRLDMASTMAEEERNVAGIVASELGIAKVFGIDQGDRKPAQSFSDAQTH